MEVGDANARANTDALAAIKDYRRFCMKATGHAKNAEKAFDDGHIEKSVELCDRAKVAFNCAQTCLDRALVALDNGPGGSGAKEDDALRAEFGVGPRWKVPTEFKADGAKWVGVPGTWTYVFYCGLYDGLLFWLRKNRNMSPCCCASEMSMGSLWRTSNSTLSHSLVHVISWIRINMYSTLLSSSVLSSFISSKRRGPQNIADGATLSLLTRFAEDHLKHALLWLGWRAVVPVHLPAWQLECAAACEQWCCAIVSPQYSTIRWGTSCFFTWINNSACFYLMYL